MKEIQEKVKGKKVWMKPEVRILDFKNTEGGGVTGFAESVVYSGSPS